MEAQRHENSQNEERLLVNDSVRNEAQELSEEDTKYEEAVFKPKVFFEFTSYFLLAQWLGPLSYYLFIKFIRNGSIIARNLHIFGGWKEIVRTLLWLAKIYCFFITYTLGLSQHKYGLKPYDARGEFWLVIYTDICLSVLHGAYYSSFTENEIRKFKTQVYDPGYNIITKIVQLIKKEKTKAFDKRVLLGRFPEIDTNNFYFVYPQKYQSVIPEELEPHPINPSSDYVRHILITNGLIVGGDKYSEYVANKGGYEELSMNVMVIQIISRVIVFIRLILPVIQNVEKMIENGQAYHVLQLVGYIFQQIFYCYFISKFAEIYDVLFFGILLYYRRLRLLRLLRQLIDVRAQTSQSELLKIIPTVPHNIENWLTLRKIFAAMNQQAFVVIDINMSFTLLYTILFIGFYALYAVGLVTDLLEPIGNFFEENSILQAAIFFTVVIVVVVLVFHLTLGIMINLLFRSERKEWTLQSEIMRNIKLSPNLYSDWKQEQVTNELLEVDEYLERLNNVQSLIGANYKEHFEFYFKRLRDSVFLVLDGLNYEENINPHTLLGIKTTPRLAISVITFISAVGLTTINDIINNAHPRIGI